MGLYKVQRRDKMMFLRMSNWTEYYFVLHAGFRFHFSAWKFRNNFFFTNIEVSISNLKPLQTSNIDLKRTARTNWLRNRPYLILTSILLTYVHKREIHCVFPSSVTLFQGKCTNQPNQDLWTHGSLSTGAARIQTMKVPDSSFKYFSL